MNFLVCDLSLIDNSDLISDRFISYEDGDYNKHWNNYPNEHAMNSWHGFACALKGRFVTAPLDNWADHIRWADVILFLVTYNCKMPQQVIEQAKKLGKFVLLGFHENLDRMVMLIKQNLQWAIDFRDCANKADILLSYPNTSTCEPMYRGMGIITPIKHIVSPYWIEKRKDFINTEKYGCFIGPQKKDQEIERRNWFLNVTCAINEFNNSYTGKRITTINASNQSNSDVEKILNELIPKEKKDQGLKINVVSKINWYDFLKLVSEHEVLINLDSSDTNGQADLDALFVGTNVINPLGYYMTDHGNLWEKFLQKNNKYAISVFLEKFFSYDSCSKSIEILYNQTKEKNA